MKNSEQKDECLTSCGNIANAMLAVRCGYSRRVLLIGKWAIKIATDKNGRRCNIGELHYSQLFPNSELFNKHLYTFICPVLLSLFNCYVIVMPRCKEYKDGYQSKKFLELESRVIGHKIPAELLERNIGWFKNNLVVFDYCQ